MKQAITAFALVALTALTGCASDGNYNQDGHHKNWRDRALESRGGGAHLQGTADDVLSSGCCG